MEPAHSTQSDQIKGKNGWQWTILCGVSTPKAVSYCEFELNKNNSMNVMLAYIAVSFSAFADHGLTRFYLLNR